ncbi:YiiD C-terminal domain-containing protein [Neisseria sicca]
MNPKTLQDFLHAHIPATALLDLSVLETTADQTVLFAPHAPNRNHKNTAFGGSIALAATVGGWATVYLHCPESDGNIVIQEGTTRYLRPARGNLTIITRSPPAEEWQKLKTMFERHKKEKSPCKPKSIRKTNWLPSLTDVLSYWDKVSAVS